MLEKLFELFSEKISEISEIGSIIEEENLDNLNEILDIPDDEINIFVRRRINNEENVRVYLKAFEEIKQDQMIKKLDYDAEQNQFKEKVSQIQDLFETIGKPEDIYVSGEELIVKYDLSGGSELDKKISELEKWNENRVIDSISEKYGVPSDSISFIDNLNDYITIVSDLADNNYVSRGQKDCSFEFKTSLHRIYENGSKVDMNDYESLFKQRLVYYDEGVERKSDEELRAYGQHFGLPTNYLDFTEAHLISLLFAVEDYEYLDNHAIVFFVDAFSHNKEAVKQETKLVNFSDIEAKATI